jgi:hypothetical protein
MLINWDATDANGVFVNMPLQSISNSKPLILLHNFNEEIRSSTPFYAARPPRFTSANYSRRAHARWEITRLVTRAVTIKKLIADQVVSASSTADVQDKITSSVLASGVDLVHIGYINLSVCCAAGTLTTKIAYRKPCFDRPVMRLDSKRTEN